MIYRTERDQGKMKTEPYAGMYDFDGSCAPTEDFSRSGLGASFTLGVFIWVRASSGKRLKRGSVIKRFKGYRTTGSIAEAYVKARKFCEDMNHCLGKPKS